MRHKHADIIIEWAETGRKLQYVDSYGEWHDVLGAPYWHAGTKYRFKPEVVKYRRYLCHYAGKLTVMCCDGRRNPKDEECHGDFIRWIDTEWQEVEVE